VRLLVGPTASAVALASVLPTPSVAALPCASAATVAALKSARVRLADPPAVLTVIVAPAAPTGVFSAMASASSSALTTFGPRMPSVSVTTTPPTV
jgi:hypothetical protein